MIRQCNRQRVDRNKWHQWYAWYPVKVVEGRSEQMFGGYTEYRKCVWLEMIWRRLLRHNPWEGYVWEYSIEQLEDGE